MDQAKKKRPIRQDEALKEKPFQGNDTLTITKIGYNGKIPIKDIMTMEKELFGMAHGFVALRIFIRDGKFQFSKIEKEYTRPKDISDE